MKTTRETADEFLAWFLQPGFEIPDPGIKFNSTDPDSETVRLLNAHPWQSEPAITDVHQYSHVRTKRFITNNYIVPNDALAAVVAQTFAAQDYCLPINEEYDALLTFVGVNDIELSANHLARTRSGIRNILQDLARDRTSGFSQHVIDRQQRLVNRAMAIKAEIKQARLAHLASAAELEASKDFTDTVLDNLYPALAGEVAWRQHLIASGAYAPFAHYDELGLWAPNKNQVKA